MQLAVPVLLSAVPAVTTKDIPRESERKAEAASKLDVDTAVQAAANDVKKLRKLRDKEPDPKKKAAIDAKIEGSLASQREKLEETVRNVIPATGPKPPPQRITFTFPLINAAREVAFLVSENSKQTVIDEVQQGEARHPASRVKAATWLLVY